MLSPKKGFTLMEVVLALGLAGVVFSVVMNLVADLYRSKRTLREEQILASTHYSFYTQMENKVRWAKEIISLDPFTFKDEDEVDHTLVVNADQRLVVDGTFLTPEEVEVVEFKVENFSPTKDPSAPDYLPSLKFTLNLRSKQQPTYFLEKSFVLSLRKKHVSLD